MTNERTDISRNLESFCVVWLSEQTNNSTEKTDATIPSKLRNIINHLIIFQQQHDCISYIRNVKTEHVVLIVSNADDIKVLVDIHDWPQLIAIYLFLSTNTIVPQNTNKYKKIIGVFNDAAELIERMNEDQIVRERILEYESTNSLMSFCNRTEQSSLLLNGSFMYFQLFMKPLDHGKKDLLDVCKRMYAENSRIHDSLDKFDRDYTPAKAIFWYTSPTCFYRIINKALRVHDAETMFVCCFFIYDLYQQLREEQVKFVTRLNNMELVYVYRGQLLSTDELNRIQEHVGELLSMNSFLSTSTKENVALMFTTTIRQCIDDTVSVLFRIQLDTRLETSPYADIKHLSQFSEENEVLIMAGAIFKIEAVIWDGAKEIWRVDLAICSSDEHDLQVVFDYCKQHHLSSDRSILVRLGVLSKDLGQIDTAELFFRKQLNIDPHNSWAFSGLGYVAKEQGLYQLELDYHQRALQIDLELDPNHPKVAKDYMDIGNCLRDQRDYHHALQHYQTSLKRYLNVYGDEHHEIADLYKAMGFLYRSMKDYQASYEYQQKSLTMAMKTLPMNHPYVADIYIAVAWTYYDFEDFNLALEYIKKAYAIIAKSTPATSFQMALIYHHLGHIYSKLDNVEEAVSNYQKAIVLDTKVILPMNILQARTHYELAMTYENNRQPQKALENYLHAMELFRNLNSIEQFTQAEDGCHRIKTQLEQ